MDTTDRPHANLPARLPVSPRLPAQFSVVPRDADAAPSTPSIDGRQLLRGLARNWWRVLLVWLVVSAPLVYLIYTFIQPTYQAASLLLVESNQPDLLNPMVFAHDISGQEPAYLRTQLVSITSDPVLDQALNDLKDTSTLPLFKDSKDPVADLRKKLDVQIIPNTQFIRIALESTDPTEAMKIVNEVAKAYKITTVPDPESLVRPNEKVLRKDTADALIKSLEEYKDGKLDEIAKKRVGGLIAQITEKQDVLIKLAQSGGVQVKNLDSVKPPVEGAKTINKEEVQPSFSQDALEQYRSTNELLMQTEFQLIEIDAKLHVKENRPEENPLQAGSPELDRKRIDEEFKRDPEVADVIDQIKATNDELEHATGIARKGGDPARIAAQKQLAKLKQKYNDLWLVKSEEIRQRFLVPTSASGGPEHETKAELEQQKQALELRRDRLKEMVSRFDDKRNDSHTNALKATFLQDELASLRAMSDQVDRKLAQLKFTQDKAAVTIPRIDWAKEPRTPYNNKRLRYMALLPVGVLLAVLGLFLLLEVRAERVGDPDMLSSRVQSEVYSLPPLPTARAISKRNLAGGDDPIDRFIQRLDHLRFAVCGDHHATEMGRCILVTSAIGGEGKTTLAAQLAARCGNAGISTLLIDADLRRAALCPLLDVPEGPGLSDALEGDAKIEDLAIPVQGGTFHLLSAGTPVPDASRILQGRNFPILIAKLRQRYEMIIIDSPPVLPVPDALVLGRWTDGALLTTRFEVSRSPQVERARRQLDNAGIPVLGTVINGLRSSDSYYGRYTYSRQRTSQSDPTSAI